MAAVFDAKVVFVVLHLSEAWLEAVLEEPGPSRRRVRLTWKNEVDREVPLRWLSRVQDLSRWERTRFTKVGSKPKP